MATVAATVAVGVGVALARAERERRASRERLAAERTFELLAGERPADGLKRIALGQLDLAIELLGGDAGAIPSEQAVHETRKALKRLRALVRLLRGELGDKQLARESAALRDVGRRLAGARDAEVMLGTLDGLLERHPRKLRRRRAIRKLRARLLLERDRAVARTLGDAASRAEVLGELRAIRVRVAAWQLPDRPGIETVEVGLERIYRDGRRRYRRAARGKGDRARALHEWRKRVKDLRYAAEVLDRRGKLARRADALGEALGEEHDLAVLAALIRRRKLARKSRKTILKLISRRRAELRARSLREGARLYRPRPNELVRRVRRDFSRR